MRFAVSHVAIAASLAAALLVSAGGLASPSPVAAAQAVSALSVESAQSAQSAPSQSSQKPISQRARIVQIAQSHLGASYRFGAEGEHNRFDCSGLVYAVFKEAGLLDRIGGKRWGARTYYHWFKRQGLASRTDPKPGDLVIWHKGTHIGIYIGDGEIISAVNKKYDVRIHGLSFVSGFTAYLHVPLNGGGPGNGGGSTTPITVKTTMDDLVMRSGPGDGYDRVALLARGTVISVIEKATDRQGRTWVHGKLPGGKIGWVRARHVKVVD